MRSEETTALCGYSYFGHSAHIRDQLVVHHFARMQQAIGFFNRARECFSNYWKTLVMKDYVRQCTDEWHWSITQEIRSTVYSLKLGSLAHNDVIYTVI